MTLFQLTKAECEILRCKNSTSSWGGHRYNPFAFTEQSIYMLMTVLKGPLAAKQSKALIRIFKQMKDYIVDNQPLLGQREYLQLALQTTQNTQDLLELHDSLSAIDDRVASIVDTLGNVVTKSELANVMQDFCKPSIRRDWLILNGQPVESDLAYQQIYSSATKSIFVVDNSGQRWTASNTTPSSMPTSTVRYGRTTSRARLLTMSWSTTSLNRSNR